MSLLKVDVDKALQGHHAVSDDNLISAVVSGDISTVKVLIQHGANVNALGHGNANCIMNACDGITDSYEEGRQDFLEIAWLLIQKRCDVNPPPTLYDATPLRKVVEKGDLVMLKMLIHSKADVRDAVMGKDGGGIPAIDFVKRRIQPDVIEVHDWIVIDKDQQGKNKDETQVIKAGTVGLVKKVSDSGLQGVQFLFGDFWVKAHVKAKMNEFKQILDLLEAPETIFKFEPDDVLSCPDSVSGPTLLKVAEGSK